ncbi:hypothetical protein [Rhodococcus rhodochrous]|uniref:hypothetical protein n=1 Tax=Rhodococcus rhodochrous TaxID=1829 RepID=UPI0024B9F768|nr:hypothetical protein [Rhodococcus rhodochrous]MDJ0400884.1 hypothetical protein [Rhodococcus rhodochrous]
MIDPTMTAASIANDWTRLGVKLPKSLTTAITVYEEIRYVAKPKPTINIDDLTVENLADTISQVTDNLVRADKHAEAVREVRNRLASQVLREAGAAVPTVLEQFRDRFDAAVTKFAKAAERLPDDLSSDSLVKAGPDALVALGEAREAAAEIKQVESYLASLVQLPAYSVFGHHPALRIFAPESPEQLSVLTNARNNKRHDPLVRELGPILWHGIKAGVPTALNTPDESARIEQELKEQARAAAAAARI